MDSQKQDFWKEAILKENLLRLNWFRQNWVKHPKPPVRERKVKLPKVPEIAGEKSALSETTDVQVAKPKQLDNLSDINVMRPVSSETRTELYQGFSKEETGRYRYLLLRKRKNPEDKYLYPITSNWQYGWGLGECCSAV